MSDDYCKYSPLYTDADRSFVVNFNSKNLRPIRISLPAPPKLSLIDGFGLHPDDQKFNRFEMPIKLMALQKKILRDFQDSVRSANGVNILQAYWNTLEADRNNYVDEINFIKRFIYFMNYGYWCYIDGKPTFIPGWYFSYLNIHRMTTEKGYQYPEYRKKGLYRFLFRHYIWNTTETFADLDKEGIAYKVMDENGKLVYRMADVGKRTFFGTIEPKDRRGGLTNEYCHIITRIMTSERGADKLGTIVSLGGENAETHFRKKLIPAWNSWYLFLKPIWKGGMNVVKQLEFTASMPTDIETLDCMINYTESAEDLANDGKMILAAGYDEQGKGKRTGNVQTRWQINKETMSLGGGSKIIGFCMHPSTVEQMNEGGADFKEMADSSNFYQRKADGQTTSGLSLCYMPSSFCLEGFIDAWGNPVYEKPTPRQIQAGFESRIGSSAYIRNKRKDLNVPDDPKKMSDLKSFVRKFPEDYDECWTGVSGQLGLDNDKLREKIIELENKSQSKRGNFYWIDKAHYIVGFNECADGRWVISYEMPYGTANRMSSMMDYSAIEDDEILVNRPADPKFIVGLDPAQFSNNAEAVHIKGGHTKKSDTGICVLRKRDKEIDKSDNPAEWTTRQIVAFFRERLSSSIEAANEALMAAIYYGGLIHCERNRSEVWERLIEWRMGGYLNYDVEISAQGDMRKAAKPGTHMGPENKKDGFALLGNFITFHSRIQKVKEWMKEADEISSMEQLTGYDGLSAVIEALFGDESPYAEIMSKDFGDSDEVFSLGATTYNY
jgi:hypothetical protein